MEAARQAVPVRIIAFRMTSSFRILPAAGQQGVERLRLRVRQSADLRPHPLGEERQHRRVDRIGLRELAGRAGEVAHLAGSAGPQLEPIALGAQRGLIVTHEGCHR